MIIDMYITMLPVIIGGILNMIFTKTPFYKKHRKPIDNNMTFKNGKRLFGDNKTWTGFISMIIFCIIAQVFYGLICYALNLEHHNDLYFVYHNSILFNLTAGFLFGFAYMLFELPNSFIKRQLDIESGKHKHNLTGGIFFVIDQIDSMFGVILVLYILSEISVMKYFGYVALGGITHITVNIILYQLKIRRNL